MIPPKAVEALPWRLRRVIRRPWVRRFRLVLTPKARRRLRAFLNRHGHVTPNFTWAETVSKDGREVPPSLRANAIRHSWKLEQFRHKIGDRPIGILSWYRSPEHNRAVGGATRSKHMEALATDLKMPIAGVSRAKAMDAANDVWKVGGVGDYPSGAMHVDSRDVRARWSSF